MKTTRPTSTPPPTRAHGLGCVTQANWSPETRSGSPRDVCRQEVQSGFPIPVVCANSCAATGWIVDVVGVPASDKARGATRLGRHQYARVRVEHTRSDPAMLTTTPDPERNYCIPTTSQKYSHWAILDGEPDAGTLVQSMGVLNATRYHVSRLLLHLHPRSPTRRIAAVSDSAIPNHVPSRKASERRLSPIP